MHLTSATQVDPGDKVRCIRGYGSVLIEGEIYTVMRRGRLNSAYDADNFVMIEGEGAGIGGWSVDRFELVERAAFKPGDRVRIKKATFAPRWIGYEATVLHSGNYNDAYLRPIGLRPDGGGGDFYWGAANLELVAEPTHLERVRALVARITPPARRRFRVEANEHGAVFLQTEGKVRDLTDPLNPGPKSWQRGGKRYVSEHAVDSEVVQCALRALLDFDEHETREAFLFDGVRLFGPHITLDALKSVADTTETRH